MNSRLWQTLALCMTALGGVSVQAEVWKCKVEGRLHYSDQPCQSLAKGGLMPSRALEPNIVGPIPPARTASAPGNLPQAGAFWTAGEAAAPSAPLASVCPSDRDIASMETTASSTTLPAGAKRFVQDEIRRAWQCRKGQGRYSAADWRISREAVEAQSSLSGAESARIRSESMHSAANPNEGELIARQRAAEARAALRDRRSEPAPAASAPGLRPD
ncbi:hypothetical protein ACS5PK_21075 [Roseateles sp. DB2]|uniref:hypothetical protein n=1 Tax=Roseateles sp. DB2 TaxID=3453717 RepID=UPI003EE8498A